MASSDHLLPPTNPFSPARSSLKPSVISLPSTRGTLSNHPSPRSLLPSMSSRTLTTRQFSVEKTDLSVYPDWLSRRKDFQDMKSKYERLDTIDCFQVCLKPILMRTDLDVKALTKTVKRNPFFSSMKEAQLVEVVERLHSIHFPAKAVLMAKSDPADCLFLILSGKVGVYIETGKCVYETYRPHFRNASLEEIRRPIGLETPYQELERQMMLSQKSDKRKWVSPKDFRRVFPQTSKVDLKADYSAPKGLNPTHQYRLVAKEKWLSGPWSPTSSKS